MADTERPVWFVPVMLHVPAPTVEDAVERVHAALDAHGSATMPVTVNGLEIVYVSAAEKPAPSEAQWFADRAWHYGYDLNDNGSAYAEEN
jgi:hypothetical protein